MLILRKFLFWTFLFAYLIVCPFIVLYSLGIIFDPNTQQIQETGIIYISTIPKNAKVFLNNKRQIDTTPIIIDGLREGRYRITVKHPGYRSWEKILPVQKQKSTALKRLLLIPKKWPKQNSEQKFSGLVNVEQKNFALLNTSSLLKDYVFYQNNPAFLKNYQINNSLSPVLPEKSPWADAKVKNIFTRANSSFFVIHSVWNNQDLYLWCRQKNTSVETKNITNLIVSRPSDIVWERSSATDLFFLTGKEMTRIDLTTDAVYPGILKNIKTFTVHKKNIYAITNNNELIRSNFSGEQKTVLLKDKHLTEKLFHPYKHLLMDVLTDKIILFLSKNGSLMMNQLPHIFVEKNVKGISFDTRHQRILFFTDKQLGFIDLTTDEENKLFEQGPQVTWISVKEKGIQQAVWANNGENIIFRDKKYVYITERLSFGQPQSHRISRVKRNTSVMYSDQSGRLLFIDRKGYLTTVQIRPENEQDILDPLLKELPEPEEKIEEKIDEILIQQK